MREITMLMVIAAMGLSMLDARAQTGPQRLPTTVDNRDRS